MSNPLPPEGMILYPSGLIGFATPGGTIQNLNVPPPGTFITSIGSNEFDLTGSGFLGVQGYIDVRLTFGTPPIIGKIQLLFGLFDDISGGAIVAYLLGAGNKIIFSHIDGNGNTVAETALVGDFPSGTTENLIYLWDTLFPVNDDGYYSLAIVGSELAPWTTEPTSPFTPFTPTRLVFGQPYEPAGYTIQFHGTTHIGHLSSNGHPVPPTSGSLPPLFSPGPGPGPGPGRRRRRPRR